MDKPPIIPFGIGYLERLPNMGYDVLDKKKVLAMRSREIDIQQSDNSSIEVHSEDKA